MKPPCDVQARSHGEPQFRLYSFDDLLTADLPERVPMLGSWLTVRHRCMIYAPTGLGKSLFATSIAIAIAGGGRVFGWSAATPRRVLIVDGEMDLKDLQDRARMLLEAVESVDREQVGINLTMLARHGQDADADFFDLADESGQAALLRIVDDLRPELVVLDNFSTLAEVQDENEAHSFNPIIRLMNTLSARGCAVILVHHSRKATSSGGGNFRGSSKISATFESIIELRQRDDLGPEESGFTIQWEKFRSDPANRGAAIKVKLARPKEGGSQQWSIEAIRHQELFDLVAAWRSLEFPTQMDLAAHIGVSKGEVTKRKHAAIRAGLITDEEWTSCGRTAMEVVVSGTDERIVFLDLPDFTAE